MKRSEMVSKLAEFIALFEDQHPDACLNLADQYLRVCEQQGMIPPMYTCINSDDKTPNQFGSCPVHEWEPEDEA